MMEAYSSVYKTEGQEVISEETQELEEQQGGAMRGIKGPLHYLDTLLQGRKKADEIARNRGVLPKTGGDSGGESGGGSGSGMSAAEIKAAQDAANKARQQGKMSDLRGGGGNTGKSPISNLSNALDKPSVVSPKTGETTKFERRLPTMAELRAAQAARAKAKAGGATDREAGYQAVKAGVGVSKPNPIVAVTGGVNPRAGSYAAYQNNVLKQLGSDYGRLPQNTIKPVVKRTMKKEAYDVVLDYLLSEGHVDTVEEAHYVMLQMTSEHVQDIVEGLDK